LTKLNIGGLKRRKNGMKIPQEYEGLSKRDLIRELISLNSMILNQQELIDKQQMEIEELKRRLLAYENAHTPPSQQRKYPKREKSNNKVGAPKNHKGVTRPKAKPNKFEVLQLCTCPGCNKKLGEPISTEKKIIEDIPEPQPLIITEFTIPHYFCNNCDEEVIPTHPDLPDNGVFGPNVQSYITSLRYENRLPPRKISELLENQYGIYISHSTILDILKRVSDKLQPEYDKIKEEVRNSKQANADETGKKVNGEKFWNWAFITLSSVLFLIRKSRGQKPIKEALGEKYEGFLGCDGWEPYAKIAKFIQRCWAHLLREAKWYAQKYEGQSRLLYNALCRIYGRIIRITVETVKGVRTRTYNWCMKEMKAWIKTCKAYTELRKFAEKIENGLDYWFTCVLHPEIEPTNNKAERALREIVIQEKISKLRTEKGARIMEIIMSVLATWELRGLNTFTMLRRTLSS
jgi:transposase/uncharacterized coiled-coil protein SlyX